MAYEYAIEILTPDGRELGRSGVSPDWRAALEWVRFEGIRAGRLRAVTGDVAGTVEPVWDGRTGAPYVAAFRASVRENVEVTREIPKAYVLGLARQVASALVEQGVLQTGDAYRWAMCAVPARAVAAASAGSDPFQVEPVEQPLALDAAPLDAFLARAVALDADEAGAMPVFVPQHVLDEARDQACEAADVETGGILVGKLHRDSAPRAGASPELFIEVTAQVPAPYTRAASTKLTFTADTWAAVRAAIALRRRTEQMLGWWHHHPNFCRLRGCPPERHAGCAASSPFLSAEDLHLHASCFPGGHHLALLISDNTATGLTWSLFGWSRGMIAHRGFHLMKGAIDATQRSPGF